MRASWTLPALWHRAFGTLAALVLFPATAAAQADCTSSSVSLCQIAFEEEVSGVPIWLRTANGLDVGAEPVSVPRRALVVPATTGTGPRPLVVYNGGHGSTAAGSAGALGFENKWPEAVIVYAEAGRLLTHGGFWKSATASLAALTDTDWSPRFPHRESGSDHSDLPYMQEALDRVTEIFDIDPERMFVAGHSSGGFFTLSLMDFMPDRFRAFAVLGAHADYGDAGNSSSTLQEVIDAGQVDRPRAVLYMMANREDEFPWSPAIAGRPDYVHRTIRQLAARNGATIPETGDRGYINDLLGDLGAAPADQRFVTQSFPRRTASGAEVVLGLYGGDDSWPPKDADDPSLDATEWAVSFFREHDTGLAFPPGWFVPVMALPTVH